MSARVAVRGPGPLDLLRIGSLGLRTRRLRAALTATGIAIGIAAMVAVLAISESSRAELLAVLDRLGTNLLTVTPGQTLGGDDASLPRESAAMARRIGPVESVASTERVEATVRRTDLVPEAETGGISVLAADTKLLETLGGSVRDGTWLTDATSRYPAVVLGSTAAKRLGIEDLDEPVNVWIGDRWFTVVGILDSFELVPELDRAVFVGRSVAESLLGAAGSPTSIYVRTSPETIDDVRSVLAATVDPENPEEVRVDRPSDALEARAAATTAFTALFLGLGAVALLVGGVGIANVMLMSVLERRSEIGLRRALGATRRDIVGQFLTESLVLAGLGGAIGVALGAVVAIGYASSQSWPIVIPAVAFAGGLGAALVVGAVAGLYPAVRAARLSPTEALRTV